MIGSVARVVAAWLLACACGRFSFDEPDAVAAECIVQGHDEDGDTIDDGCDVCPHRGDTDQADLDGDRVGDACDPEPALARQRIELFDPFVTRDPVWRVSNGGVVNVSNDELVLSGSGSVVGWFRPFVPARDHFVVAVTTTTAPVGQRAVFALIADDDPSPASFYCELFENGTGSLYKFTYTLDGANFMSPDSTMVMPSFTGGSGVFEFDIDPSSASCSATWRGEMLAAIGVRPTAFEADSVRIFVENIEARVAYFVHIRAD
jgi:hypothetical protein